MESKFFRHSLFLGMHPEQFWAHAEGGRSTLCGTLHPSALGCRVCLEIPWKLLFQELEPFGEAWLLRPALAGVTSIGTFQQVMNGQTVTNSAAKLFGVAVWGLAALHLKTRDVSNPLVVRVHLGIGHLTMEVGASDRQTKGFLPSSRRSTGI